jgi:hypothetical protein
MHKPTFYALVIIEPDGSEHFGGAYVDYVKAENKGRQTGQRFEVRPAYLQ